MEVVVSAAGSGSQEGAPPPVSLLLIALAAAAFAGLGWLAWAGTLGFKALGLLLVSVGLYFVGRRKVGKGLRGQLDMVAKVLFTVVGGVALLRHPIEVEGGAKLPVYEAISAYIDQVDSSTFFFYAFIAMAVKFVGVISSAFAWHLLLVGQGIRYPFWSKIMTAFLIGRFIGTFMPSTIGLDGYTLYEAGRYSNQWPRAITAKALEKFIGITGLFLGMVLTMPFGYSVIVDVTSAAGKPESAPLLAGVITAVAGGISAVVVIGLIFPGAIIFVMNLVGRVAEALAGVPGIKKIANRALGLLLGFTEAVGAYRGQLGLLMTALVSKFITHFTTAVVYYFTALAIGVTTAKFWPIVFGSTIQILATIFAPTIAGEGAREAFQAILLSKELGGVAQAVLSGALGFLAAEAATLWGGAFLWTRVAGWRPAFALVDGKQVDYAWINDDEDGSFDAEKLARAQAEHAAPPKA
ncbi:MAG: hypothetical protein IPO67_00055 [Deltaproteobacteria bacterium]|nr:hypothetical protein [Deltaproteobacteria bacterium]